MRMRHQVYFELLQLTQFKVMDKKLEDRVVGSLVGLAVCDAVGTTVESMPPGSFDPVLDMVGGGKFNHRCAK